MAPSNGRRIEGGRKLTAGVEEGHEEPNLGGGKVTIGERYRP